MKRSLKAMLLILPIFSIAIRTLAQGPAGYQECGPETYFEEPTNVAFGNNGNYKYLFNQVGQIVFSRGQFFGGPSSAEVEKAWYQTISEMDVETPSANLKLAFSKLKKHLIGESVLTPKEITLQDSIIQANISAIGIKKEIIKQSFELVRTYEETEGPLFDIRGKRIMLPREVQPGMEIHYALFYIMDAITRSYSAAKLEEFPEVYQGAMFKTAAYFPGMVNPPKDAGTVYRVKVKASQTANWGTPIYFHQDAYSRRPTGAYVAPGTLVTIKVPSAVVDKGYTIRIGTHFWDLRYRNRIARLDRATIIYPVIAETITVGSPLGGNIYFEVPEGKEDGIIDLEITGAVRSPYFSTREYNRTSLEDWNETERHHPGAWADFESDKFLMQVPTSWIYDFDNPKTMLNRYDRAMDAVANLLGKPLPLGTHFMFRQVDAIMRAGVHAPGYPEINVTYDPTEKSDGKGNHIMLQSPVEQPWVIFHEMGHSHVPSFFENETESIVNLLHVAVANHGFGMELDSAFGWSVSNRLDVDLDRAAINLMVTDPFRNDLPLNRDRMSYQHRGHGKYVDVVRLFGWDALGNMFKQVNEDYNRGIIIKKTHHPTDDRILRMSVAASADLRPLLHFWGRPPENNSSLSDSLEAAGLNPSREIFETLEHYKSILPKTLAQAQAHAKWMFPKEGHPSADGHDLERDMAFIHTDWNEAYAAQAIDQIERIQKRYFPKSWVGK
ncbi:Peptidase M60, enhancin and enhancin-like [Cyclobacterium xiamenense]|uniref:Peptidase M60, enhancin and enhancin-like n=1 Tax=Cyclobacterium xiamenense TaxID=1297121 RepID=A0A1H6TIF8_9BACT|nr:M60 family metallopeptidase [Cyclobacterium xiamenense]SEI75995.1 Peptidase M60, enhancin and enhancin-like [Cyclobacterium xiamenense]